MRILLIRLSALGDCIHALPVVNALRRQLPDAEIGWAIQDLSLRLLEGHPAVDHFHLYPRRARGPGAHLRALLRFRRELRRHDYEVAIDVQGLFKSGLVALWSGAPVRIGFAGRDSREMNRFFVNRRVDPGASRHVVDRNLELLRALDLEAPEVEWRLPRRSPSSNLQHFFSTLGAGAPVLLNPGTTWPTKRWSSESYAELAATLVERAGRPVVVAWGDRDEEREAERIVAGSGSSGVVLAPATNLPELQELITRSALFVAGDTGPLHLAVAVGTPVVALFGPTDPERNGPYRAAPEAAMPIDRAVVLSAPEELDCRPCQKSWCRRRDLACLRRLTAARVAESCLELLAHEESRPGGATDAPPPG